jgi:hypothetical protein
MAGKEGSNACYWTSTGSRQRLSLGWSEGADAYASAITFIGNDLYIGGSADNWPVYWKNGGSPIALPAGEGSEQGEVDAIQAFNGEVYLLGTVNSYAERASVVYWKDGALTTLLGFDQNKRAVAAAPVSQSATGLDSDQASLQIDASGLIPRVDVLGLPDSDQHVASGTVLSLTAKAAGADQFLWFVDGVQLDLDGSQPKYSSSISLDTGGLDTGSYHSLTAVARIGGTWFSSSRQFFVMGR